MKKTHFTLRQLFFATLLTMSFFSCKKNDLQKDSVTTTTLHTAKLSISKLGLDTSKVVDMGDFYLVGHDIGIKKTSLASTMRRQVYFNTNPFVSSSKQNNITVRINNDMPSDGSNLDWRAAIPMAISQWNSVSTSKIKFTLVNTPTADITIHTQAINDASLCAFIDDWPTGGMPSQYISINTLYHYHYSNYTNDQKKWVMVHELGHAVNIAHTDEYYYWNTTKIDGSPDVDGNSVFNCCMAGLTFSDFSYWDEYAITYLYPLVVYSNIAKSQNFTKNDCSGASGTTVTYSVLDSTYTSPISQADADQKAQNDINANGQNYANINGSCYTVTSANSWSGSGSYYGFSVGFKNLATGINYTMNSSSVRPQPERTYVPVGNYTVSIQQSGYPVGTSFRYYLVANGQLYQGTGSGAQLINITNIPITSSGINLSIVN